MNSEPGRRADGDKHERSQKEEGVIAFLLHLCDELNGLNLVALGTGAASLSFFLSLPDGDCLGVQPARASDAQERKDQEAFAQPAATRSPDLYVKSSEVLEAKQNELRVL